LWTVIRNWQLQSFHWTEDLCDLTCVCLVYESVSQIINISIYHI
jgi:hypothetical protein